MNKSNRSNNFFDLRDAHGKVSGQHQVRKFGIPCVPYCTVLKNLIVLPAKFRLYLSSVSLSPSLSQVVCQQASAICLNHDHLTVQQISTK